jgi:hypothetical protein
MREEREMELTWKSETVSGGGHCEDDGSELRRIEKPYYLGKKKKRRSVRNGA